MSFIEILEDINFSDQKYPTSVVCCVDDKYLPGSVRDSDTVF